MPLLISHGGALYRGRMGNLRAGMKSHRFIQLFHGVHASHMKNVWLKHHGSRLSGGEGCVWGGGAGRLTLLAEPCAWPGQAKDQEALCVV